MCLDCKLLAAESAGASLENQMEGVFRVYAHATQLGTVDLLGVGDGACLVAVAVEGEGAQLGGRDVYGIPFEDDRGLGGIATAKDGCSRCALAKCTEDVRLKLVESRRGVCLGFDIARNIDVDYAARRNVRRQENGGELDLR